MKKLALTVLGVLLVASTSVAAPVRSYMGITSGLALPGNVTATDVAGTGADVSYKPGYSVSGVVGHEFGTGLRVEAEANYTKTDLDKINSKAGTNRLNADFWSAGLFANAYYDLLVSKMFTPYIGGGLGMKIINISDAVVNGTRIWNSSHDSAFAYHVGFGCSVRMAREVSLDLGYRYQESGSLKIDQVAFGAGNQHSILLGIRYYP